MKHFKLHAYGADRIVVAVQNSDLHKKIFQINFKSSDGSLFVEFPYAKLGAGRLGIVHCPAGTPESLHFGENAPATTHSVKYVHHPDGEAHFSQDGKIFTKIRRKAVPLTAARGHIFTVMVQGLRHFADLTQKDVPTPKRGVVPMPVAEGEINALKFVCHLYSSVDLAKMLQGSHMDSPWLPIVFEDGRRLVGIVLATKLVQAGQQYFLLVSVEEIRRIAGHTDLYVSLMGGFDPPSIVFDHGRQMSFLMLMYPEVRDMTALLDSVGSVDRLTAV